ncbi:MAG: sulfite exporter TauE/SafE family protein [Desulfoplanes sp.]|jgi:hypothetical protein|nr:sulfite exporter TauE/SafE family protein [Proteiniphilum sp.]
METVFFCAVVFSAGFIQGLSGFGSNLILLPLLTMAYPIKTIIPLAGLFALCINVSLISRLRRNIRIRPVLLMLSCSLPGIPCGVLILKMVSPVVLEVGLGFVLVSFAGYSLFGRFPRREIASWWALVAGFISGCLGGSLGTNGPPILIYTAIQPWTKNEVKGVLAAFFLLSGIGVTATQWLNGLLTLDVFSLFRLGLPALLAGIVLGLFASGRIGDASYRKGVTVLIFMLGLSLLAKGMG